MSKSTRWTVAAVILCTPIVAAAGEAAGIYANHNDAMTETKLANGNREVIYTFRQVATSDKADNPFGGTDSTCVARMVLSGEGKTLAGSGYCFGADNSGNGMAWSWKVDEAATPKCPTVCGSFSMSEGFGDRKGASGTGTWVQTHIFKSGSYGTYKTTYKR